MQTNSLIDRLRRTAAFWWHNLTAWLMAYWWLLATGLGIALGLPVLIAVSAYVVVRPYDGYVLSDKQLEAANLDVGLVLGAGVNKQTGRPYKELQSRLDVAAVALLRGDVQKLILSGDNRFEDYDEPTVMKRYLMQTYGIAADRLQPDFAGRSTYESCERAAKVFGQRQVVLFSAESHLPRAIYLCRHFGIETYGVASDLEANNATRREALARVKAVYNLYIRGEKTILGPTISF